MRKRSIKNKKLDKKIFRKTAVKSKSVNVDVPLYRGGIRL